MLVNGSFISEMSGSLGGITAARNKGGQYLRQRAVPTTSTTAPALAAKARLASAAAAYGGLTQLQRDSWTRYGSERPETNALGQVKILPGISIHNRIFTRMDIAADTPLTTAPIGNDPDAFSGLAATFDIGTGTTTITFTNTPLAATEHMWLEAALVDSAGIEYVEDKKRFITVTAGALASGFDYLTVVEAVLGTLTVGQKLILFPMIYEDTTGLLSQRLRVSGIIIDTP